jgi:hypothetical protein
MTPMQVWPIPIPYPCPTPPPSGMAEWVKILLSALSGLVIGTLLEPVRASIQHHFAMHRTHKIVADEINALALTMGFFLQMRKQVPSPENPMTQKPGFNTERFQYAYDNNRDHLYHIPGWDSLKRFYDAIEEVKRKDSRLSDDEMFHLNMEFALLAERAQQGIFGPVFKKVLIDNKFSNLPKVANEVLTKPMA